MKIIKQNKRLSDFVEQNTKDYLIENKIFDLYLEELNKNLLRLNKNGVSTTYTPFTIMDISWNRSNNGLSFWFNHYEKIRHLDVIRKSILISEIIKIL